MRLARPEKVAVRPDRGGPNPRLSCKTLKWMRVSLTARVRDELSRRSDVNRFTVALNEAGSVITLTFCPVNGVTDVQRREIPFAIATALGGATGLSHTHNIQIAGNTAVMLFDLTDGATINTKKIPSGSYLMRLLNQIPHSTVALVAAERVVYSKECIPKACVVWHVKRRGDAPAA